MKVNNSFAYWNNLGEDVNIRPLWSAAGEKLKGLQSCVRRRGRIETPRWQLYEGEEGRTEGAEKGKFPVQVLFTFSAMKLETAKKASKLREFRLGRNLRVNVKLKEYFHSLDAFLYSPPPQYGRGRTSWKLPHCRHTSWKTPHCIQKALHLDLDLCRKWKEAASPGNIKASLCPLESWSAW